MRGIKQFVGASVAVMLIGLTAVAVAGPVQARPRDSHPRHELPRHGHKATCQRTRPAVAQCHADVITDGDTATPLATTSYAYGYRPTDLQQAYSVPTAAGSPTVAIVDAYDNPNAEADFAAYRSQFGMTACTTANGCFKKVNQTGGATFPAPDPGWAQEIALDIDMVAAVCPNCRVLLVEATSNNFSDLLTALDYATSHASFVSNSWGTSEFNGEQNYENHFNRPGIAITVSSGDAGYGVEYPAASAYAVAVGGTSLHIDTASNRTGETAWSGAGSGCSAYIAKPAWQSDTGCARRTVADVSAVADPNTGVAVYSSYGSGSGGNWLVFGGTSAAAPIIAALYAVAGPPTATIPASYPYGARSSLFDVTSGANSSGCTTYLCSAVAGFDGPTGLGTPNGAAAFAAPGSPPVTTTTTTAPVTTTTTQPPTTTTSPTDKPPVIDSQSKSCSAATCTFSVKAHDPEGKVLTYAWTGSTSTTASARITFTTAGTGNITVSVKDGVNTTTATQTVTCRYVTYWYGKRLRCS